MGEALEPPPPIFELQRGCSGQGVGEQREGGEGEPTPSQPVSLVLQLTVEALEQEKQGLQSQIAQVLEGRQQLAHLKMSLSLEVATYRYGTL